MSSDALVDHFYVVLAVYESSGDPPIYEERLTLITAGSEEEARRKAEQAAQAFVHSYKNVEGGEVTWRCKQIIDVALMVDEAWVDGAEVYGRYFKDFDAYERFEPRLKGQPLD